MHQIQIWEFARLLTPSATPCVSIFLPTTPAGVDLRADKLRLRNAVKIAWSRLEALQAPATDLESMLAAANQLLDDDTFWKTTQRGFAVWLSPTDRFFLKSAQTFRESVTVGDSFRIRTLVPCLGHASEAFVLALSQEQIRFFHVKGGDSELLSLPALPSNLRGALNETSVDRGAQSHSVGKSLKRKQTTVYHAQGAGHDTEKQDLNEYCRKVAAVVDHYLMSKQVPLILACVESLAPLYRHANNYPNLLPEIIVGSPDRLTPRELADLAAPIVAAELFQDVAKQLRRFKDLSGVNRTSTDTAQIVQAAIEGHVDQLFFDDSRDVGGRFEKVNEVVDVHDVPSPTDVDLIDLAVAETLRHRGRVHAISSDQLPSPLPMAAILRNVPGAIPMVAHN